MKFKLTIDKNTFIWLKGNKGLIYNSSNFKSFEFIVSDSIRKICESLESLDSLYQVSLDESYIQDSNLRAWIDNMRHISSAEIRPIGEKSTPSLKPVLKIQHDINKILNGKNYAEAINSLKEITIYLNGTDISVEEEDFHKQFIYPLKSDETLNIKQLTLLLQYIPQKSNIKLNFVGDYSTYIYQKELFAELCKRTNVITFYFRIVDAYNQRDLIQFIANNYDIRMICRCTDKLPIYINFFKHNIDNSLYSFIISSEKDMNFVESINKESIEYTITPLYTGSNKDFFKKYIFISKNDCIKCAVDKRHIFMNQVLNGNFFGKLDILPDGSIWDNLNYSKIGYINNHFFEELLTVFDSNKAWFSIRNQAPCNNCLYQWLCPPPSNYELALKQPNLCNL